MNEAAVFVPAQELLALKEEVGRLKSVVEGLLNDLHDLRSEVDREIHRPGWPPVPTRATQGWSCG